MTLMKKTVSLQRISTMTMMQYSDLEKMTIYKLIFQLADVKSENKDEINYQIREKVREKY